MQDVQFISELLSVSLLKQLSGFDQDALEALYAKYDEPDQIEDGFDQDDFVDEFGRELSYLGEIEAHGSVVSTYATTFAHLYSLWSWIALSSDLPSAEIAAERYEAFMKQVGEYEPGSDSDPDVMTYAENSRGASTDLKQRTARHASLTNALRGQ